MNLIKTFIAIVFVFIFTTSCFAWGRQRIVLRNRPVRAAVIVDNHQVVVGSRAAIVVDSHQQLIVPRQQLIVPRQRLLIVP